MPESDLTNEESVSDAINDLDSRVSCGSCPPMVEEWGYYAHVPMDYADEALDIFEAAEVELMTVEESAEIDGVFFGWKPSSN